MRLPRRALARITGMFSARRQEQRLSGEFDAHIDLIIEEYIRAGMEPGPAARPP